jgi:O-antigen/teichoic acid export membrane protein
VGLPLLLPFLDLGTSAPLISGFSNLQSGKSEQVRKSRADLLAFGLRRSALSSCLILVIGFLMLVSPLAKTILGNSSGLFGDPKILLFFFAVLLSISTLLGPTQKALIGFGKNHFTMFFNLSISILTFLICLIATKYTLDPAIYALVPIFSSATVMIIGYFVTLRLLGISSKQIFSEFRKFSLHDVQSVNRNANLMLLITFFLALINYSDKYLVSGSLPLQQLPGYVYLSQIYIPGWSAITGVLIVIWPYIKNWELEHGASSAMSKFVGVWTTTCICGIFAAALFVILAPVLISFISHGGVEVDLVTTSAFGFLLFIQFAQFPIGVYLVSNKGLRFQALWLAAGAATYVPLTLFLLQVFGALGAVLGTIAVTLLFQLIPNFFCFRSMIRSKRNGSSAYEL